MCWALGPWPHDACESETLESRLSRQKALPSCDNWSEDLAWFVVPSRCSVGIAAITTEWTQDRRQPGHQENTSGGASSHRPLETPLSVPPGDPLDDIPAPDRPVRQISARETDVHLLEELCRASAMAIARCVVSRYTTAWAESLGGPHNQSWAIFCGGLLAEILNGCDRIEELKRRLWEAGEVHSTPGSKPRKRKYEALDRSTTRKARLCLDSQRIHQQGHEGVGWRSCGGHGKLSTTALIPTSPNYTHNVEGQAGAKMHEGL